MNASHGSANELSQENIKLLRLGPEKEMLVVNGVRCGSSGVNKKTMGADLPQDRRPCLYLSSPMEN
jgi:hypothetical protein